MQIDGMPQLESLPTDDQTRERLVAEVMASHRLVAKAFSAIDSPFAGEDSIHEHGRLEHELENLVGRVVELPGSVEGLQLLEQWYQRKVQQLIDIEEGAREGVTVRYSRQDGQEAGPLVLSADMAKGMRIGLMIARHILGKYPLTLTNDDGPIG